MIDPQSPFSHLPWLDSTQKCRVRLVRVPDGYSYGKPFWLGFGFNYINLHLYLTGQLSLHPQTEALLQQHIAMGYVDVSNQGLIYD